VEHRPLASARTHPVRLSDIVLPRLVADRAAHAVEHPLRVILEPLCGELLAANGAIGKTELAGLGRLGKEFLTMCGIRSQAEHDRQRHKHEQSPCQVLAEAPTEARDLGG